MEGNEEHGMFFNLTEIFHNQDTFMRFAISYRSGRIIEMWKEKKSVEFFQPYRNFPQNEMYKIILYQQTFLRFVHLKGGRDLQYTTGMGELFICGRKRRI